MENQITNMENDIDAIKNLVKKIRESNGRTEERLDVIEEFSDTMQQDLYLAMDMVRGLIEAVVPKEDISTDIMTPTNPNIAAAANARAIRQQYHSKKNTSSIKDDVQNRFRNDTIDHDRRSSRK